MQFQAVPKSVCRGRRTRAMTGALCLWLAAACGADPGTGGAEAAGADGPALTVEGRAASAAPLPPPAATGVQDDPGEGAQLQAGAGAPPQSSHQQDSQTRRALVGSWAGGADACFSGEAVHFTSTEFYTEGDHGTWSLAGDRLTIRSSANATETVGPVESDDGASQGPVETNVILVEASASRLVWRSASGETTTFVRCASPGDTAPASP